VMVWIPAVKCTELCVSCGGVTGPRSWPIPSSGPVDARGGMTFGT
jgi:hypothetical protein